MIEETLVTYLKNLTGKEILAEEKPLINNDCIVYQRVSTNSFRTQTSRGLERARFQLNIYSTTKSGARNIAETIKAAIDGNTTNFMTATLENDIDIKEIEENLYRTILDIYIWYN